MMTRYSINGIDSKEPATCRHCDEKGVSISSSLNTIGRGFVRILVIVVSFCLPSVIQADETCSYLPDGTTVKLQSWKGDYLHRPDSSSPGVTTWHVGRGNYWLVERTSAGKVKLKSWKGDYLHRPNSNSPGVTTWHTGFGNLWSPECPGENKVTLKSWKDDFLHRPDSNSPGVTTWHVGVGNYWTIEVVK